MAAETQNARIERKLDQLASIVTEQSAQLREIRQDLSFQAKETAQITELVKDKVGRVERALDDEKADRKAAILSARTDMEKDLGEARKETAALKTTLGKVVMALFTALLALIGGVILYVITNGSP